MIEVSKQAAGFNYKYSNFFKQLLLINLFTFITLAAIIFVFSLFFFSANWESFFQLSLFNFDKNNLTFFLHYECFAMVILLLNHLIDLPHDPYGLVKPEAYEVAKTLTKFLGVVAVLSLVFSVFIVLSLIYSNLGDDTHQPWLGMFRLIKKIYTFMVAGLAEIVIFGISMGFVGSWRFYIKYNNVNHKWWKEWS